MDKPMPKRPASRRLDDNATYLAERLGGGKSFAVIRLDVEYGGRPFFTRAIPTGDAGVLNSACVLFCLDGGRCLPLH
ncbi:hypothetical protein ACWNXI_12690 [Caldibacillus thermoamylovorans]